MGPLSVLGHSLSPSSPVPPRTDASRFVNSHL